VFTNANTPVHKLVQGVLQDVLQIFFYDMGDRHSPSHKIEEVIEFQKELTDMKIWEKYGNLVMFSSILTKVYFDFEK
jgi:hypothetical protein